MENTDNILFEITEPDDDVKLQGGGGNTNCDRPGGFLWGSNRNSSCTC